MSSRTASNPVAFRLPAAEHRRLASAASELGLSPGTFARQLVVRAMSDQSTTEILAEIEVLRRSISRLRDDLATAVVALLADAGKASADEARAWVDTHLIRQTW